MQHQLGLVLHVLSWHHLDVSDVYGAFLLVLSTTVTGGKKKLDYSGWWNLQNIYTIEKTGNDI
jgi:hypothetical protein